MESFLYNESQWKSFRHHTHPKTKENTKEKYVSYMKYIYDCEAENVYDIFGRNVIPEFGIEDDRKSTHTNLTWYCFPFFLLLLLLLVWHSIYNNILYFIQYHMSYWVGVPKMIHVTMYTKWVKCSSKGLSVAHKRLDILTNIWKHCTNIKLETEKQYFFSIMISTMVLVLIFCVFLYHVS